MKAPPHEPYEVVCRLERYCIVWVPGGQMKPERCNGLGNLNHAIEDLKTRIRNNESNTWSPERAIGRGQYCVVRDYEGEIKPEWGEVSP